MRTFRELIILNKDAQRKLLIAKEAAKGKYTPEVAYFEKRALYYEKELTQYGEKTLYSVVIQPSLKTILLAGFESEVEVEEYIWLITGNPPKDIKKMNIGMSNPYDSNNPCNSLGL